MGGALWFMSPTDDRAAVDPIVQVVESAAPAQEEEPVTLADLDSPAGRSEAASGVDSVAVDARGQEGGASPLESIDDQGDDPVLAFSGRFVEYVGGVPVGSIIDGSAKVLVWRENRGSNMELDVKDGEFRLELPQVNETGRAILGADALGGDLTAIALEIEAPTSDTGATFVLLDTDDLSTVTRDSERIPFGTMDVVVPVRKAAAIELSVLEEGTGRHLTDIEVLGARRYDDRALHPGEHKGDFLIEGEASPVIVEAKGGMTTSNAEVLTVGAKGYAWNRVTVDFTRSGRRTIELARAGSLHVELTGSVSRGAVFRLRGTEGQLISERRPKAGQVFLDALAPGEYQAKLERGESYLSRVILAQERVLVKAGVQSELSLDVQSQAPVAQASLTGRLYLPEQWAIDSPRLNINRISKSKSGNDGDHQLQGNDLVHDEARIGWFDFQLDGLEVGTYSIVLATLNVAQVFELPPEGVPGLVMEVPPPLDITVALEDAETGKDLPDVQTLFWSPVRPVGMRSWSSTAAARNPETGDFSIRVPATDISVRAGGASRRASELITPRAGERFVIKVRSKPSTFLELRSGEETIPWPEDEFPEAERKDGTRAALTFSSGGGKRWVTAQEPGTFILKVPKISGFQQHPPVEFTLKSGPRSTLVIELTIE